MVKNKKYVKAKNNSGRYLGEFPPPQTDQTPISQLSVKP